MPSSFRPLGSVVSLLSISWAKAREGRGTKQNIVLLGDEGVSELLTLYRIGPAGESEEARQPQRLEGGGLIEDDDKRQDSEHSPGGGDN